MAAHISIHVGADTTSRCNTYPAGPPNVMVNNGGDWFFLVYAPAPSIDDAGRCSWSEAELTAVADFAAAVAEWAEEVATLAAAAKPVTS